MILRPGGRFGAGCWTFTEAVRGGHGSGVLESTPTGFCVFLSDPDPESKFCEKPDLDPEALRGSRSLRGHSVRKNMGKFQLDRW